MSSLPVFEQVLAGLVQFSFVRIGTKYKHFNQGIIQSVLYTGE